MKKKLTYPLLVLVALIWGLIIYRIVHGSTDDAAPEVRARTSKPQIAEVRSAAPLPALKLDYRDPFLEEEVPEQLSEAPLSPEVVVPQEEQVDWSVLRYMGAILNPQTGKLVFLLNVAGEDHLMVAGGQNAGVKIVKGNSDSVLVGYQGKQKMIIKE